jgi:hypothetical protein
MPQLEEHGVPVLLPADWLSSASRLRVNLTATSGPGARSSGLLSSDTIASFDWQLAIGDTTLTEAQLLELAAAKEPLIRVQGRWHALRRGDVERALRFLERRRTDAGVVDLVRAVSGLETEEAGLELGQVTLDQSLTELLSGGDTRRFHPLATPAGMSLPLFPFQERGHGWLRMLGDLGVGAILADDMGLGKTVQAIATFVSERAQPGGEALGPTLVVCPMSVTRQWVKEIARFAPSLRVHLHHGSERRQTSASSFSSAWIWEMDQCREQRDYCAVALEERPHRPRPGVIGVGFHPQRREGLRHVDPPGMRRCILAGMEAALAAMAQIGQVAEVAGREIPPQLHRREDRAIALAVAAGVADLHVAPCIGQGFGGGWFSSVHGGPPPARRCARRPSRWSCRTRRGSRGRGCCPP